MSGPARHGRGQQGVTLIEVLLVVAITGIIAAPVTSWVLSTLQHQDTSQHLLRNAVGTGVLASNFSRDVASAARVFVGSAASDCDNASPGFAVLSIESGSEKVVYTEASAAGSDGSHKSLWRHRCDAGGVLVPGSATEVFERILPGSAGAKCLGPGQAEGACDQAQNRRVRLVLTPCPVRPAQAAAACDPTGASTPADIQLNATRRITPGFEHLAGSGPIAQITASPRSGYLKDEFTFDASNSRAGAGATYSWEFVSDGGGTAAGAAVRHTFAKPGIHQVRLTVSDATGATNVAVATVEVLTRHPIAKAIYDKDQFVFDGRQSTHPDGLALTYRWSFGDGVEREGAVVASPFPPGTEGRRRAVLWVTDSAGNSDTDAVVVDFPVLPSGPIAITPAPIPSAGKVPFVGSVGPALDPLSVTFSTEDSGPDRSWRLTRRGQTEPVATSPAATFTHTFRDGDAGEYEIARVRPDGGPTTDPVVFRVNAAPRADFDVTVANFGSATSFRGGRSTDADGSIVSWRWDLGWADWTSTGETTSHIYSNPGTYLVRLTVTDDDGATAEVVRAVTIPGTPPAPPPPRWAGNTVTWDAVPGAQEYRVAVQCTAAGPLDLGVNAPTTSTAVPADYCGGGVASATLSVVANGVRGMPSTQVSRP